MPSKELWNPRFDINTDKNGTRVHFHPPFPGVHHYNMCITNEDEGFCIKEMYKIKKSQGESIVIPALKRDTSYNIMVRPYNNRGDYLDAWILQRYSFTEVSTSKSTSVPVTTSTAQTKQSSSLYEQSGFFKGITLSSHETETMKTPPSKSIPARTIPPSSVYKHNDFLKGKTVSSHKTESIKTSSTNSIPARRATSEEISSPPSTSSILQTLAQITSKIPSHSLTTLKEKLQRLNMPDKKTTPFTENKLSSIKQKTSERTSFQKPFSTTTRPSHKVIQRKVYDFKNEYFVWNAESTFILCSFLFVALIFLIVIYALLYRRRHKLWNGCLKASLHEDSCYYRRGSNGASQATLINPNSSMENVDVSEENTACYDSINTLRTPLCTQQETSQQERQVFRNDFT